MKHGRGERMIGASGIKKPLKKRDTVGIEELTLPKCTICGEREREYIPEEKIL